MSSQERSVWLDPLSRLFWLSCVPKNMAIVNLTRISLGCDLRSHLLFQSFLHGLPTPSLYYSQLHFDFLPLSVLILVESFPIYLTTMKFILCYHVTLAFLLQCPQRALHTISLSYSYRLSSVHITAMCYYTALLLGPYRTSPVPFSNHYPPHCSLGHIPCLVRW